MGRIKGRIGHIYPLKRRIGHIYPLKKREGEETHGCKDKVKDKVH